MAIGLIPPVPKWQIFDNSGDPLAAGTLEFYGAGLSATPGNEKDTFSDADLTSANSNPLTLDSAGRATVFFESGDYKVVCKDSSGSTLWTVDGVPGAGSPVTLLSKTADYTVLSTDGKDILLLVDATAGAVTITLPDTTGISGRRYTVKKIDNGTNIVTVVGSGSDTVDGLASLPLYTYKDFASLVAASGNFQLGENNLFATPGMVRGRLTLASGDPLPNADQSAKTTLYFTPMNGNELSWYNGNSWRRRVFTERSLSLSGLSATTNYDIYLYDASGVLTLQAVAWTDATTRATSLTSQDGVSVKNGAVSYLYLGTIRCTSVAGECEDSVTKRFVWNHYNRVQRPFIKTDDTNSWTYQTATYRQARASTANQVELVNGIARETLDLHLTALASNSGSNVRIAVGIGESSTTTPHASCVHHYQYGNDISGVEASLRIQPAAGYYSYVWLEKSEASGTTTWYGDDGGDFALAGLNGTWWC